MKNIEYGDVSNKVELGDKVSLRDQVVEVIACEKTGVLMVSIDANKLIWGDLPFIKSLGLTISNPDTDKNVCLEVDYLEDSWGHEINKFLTSSNEEDDNKFFSEDDKFLGGFGSDGFSGPVNGGFGTF